FVDDFQRKAVRSQAEKPVKALFDTLMFGAGGVGHLQRDRTLPEPVKREALQLAEGWVERPVLLDKASFAVIRTPARDVGAYRLALKQAETACRLSPFDGKFQITLGIAQYRLRDFGAAIDTLARADQVNSLAQAGSPPANLAFL